MRISKLAEYGLLSCAYIARKTSLKSVNAEEIANAEGFPVQCVYQVLRRLRKSNILKSTRGPNGGYELAQTPAQISLRDIILSIDSDSFEMSGSDALEASVVAAAQIQSTQKEFLSHHVSRLVENVLASQTLADCLGQDVGLREVG